MGLIPTQDLLLCDEHERLSLCLSVIKDTKLRAFPLRVLRQRSGILSVNALTKELQSSVPGEIVVSSNRVGPTSRNISFR